MDMGPPADPTVANLSLSDPRCNSDACIAFMNAGARSQEITPWLGQFAYGRWTTWYYIAILGLCTIVYHARKWSDRQPKASTNEPTSFTQKLVAGCRYLAYRRIPGRSFQILELPSMGVLAILLLTVVFFAGLVFAARPYYRQHRGYGSPPIAIRSGLMAYACTPIMIALAGKANIITLLTGVSHEKLNVIHRWIGWIILVLSLIHTIPFFYAPLHDIGYTTLYTEFYGSGLGGATMVRPKLYYTVVQTDIYIVFWSSAASDTCRAGLSLHLLDQKPALRNVLFLACRYGHCISCPPLLARR